MQKIRLTIHSAVGLHARPASLLVKASAGFKSRLSIRNLTTGSVAVDSKSILSVLTLGVEKEHEIELTAEGEDEAQALLSLRELIESDFGGIS